MKLILVRHAEAVGRSSDMEDGMRYLTPEGRSSFRKTAKTLLKQGVEPSLILTSPLVRSVQTAEILAEYLGFFGPLLVRDELRPGFDPQKLQAIVGEFSSADEIILVGHEPDFGAVVGELLSLPGPFPLKKGAAVKLKLDPKDIPGSGSFKWLADGKNVVRQIA